MYLIFFITLLAGISSALAFSFKKKFEETLPTTVLSMTMIMYVFAIMGFLKLGYVVTLLIGGLGLIACLYFLVRYKKGFIKTISTPGLLMFLLFIGS